MDETVVGLAMSPSSCISSNTANPSLSPPFGFFAETRRSCIENPSTAVRATSPRVHTPGRHANEPPVWLRSQPNVPSQRACKLAGRRPAEAKEGDGVRERRYFVHNEIRRGNDSYYFSLTLFSTRYIIPHYFQVIGPQKRG